MCWDGYRCDEDPRPGELIIACACVRQASRRAGSFDVGGCEGSCRLVYSSIVRARLGRCWGDAGEDGYFSIGKVCRMGGGEGGGKCLGSFKALRL